MAYNKDNYAKLKQAFEEKSKKARETAEDRSKDLCARYPEIRAVESGLRATGVRIMREALAGGADLSARIARLRDENEALLCRRGELLIACGYPENYLDPQYDCPKCKDLGFVEGAMCDCLRRALIEKTYESSGIGKLMEKQSFKTFSLAYYKDDPGRYEVMKHIRDFCRKYAENFSPASGSLLFFGTTGLGKTHLSTSIAKVVIDRGYDVVYDTAQNIFSDFETERFGKGNADPDRSLTEKYFTADLLIIDDLGTEFSNQFTVSCLYNIINTRMNHGKPMLVSTNLKSEDLLSKYDSRIVSRLFGEFTAHHFVGSDIRLQKLKRPAQDE